MINELVANSKGENKKKQGRNGQRVAPLASYVERQQVLPRRPHTYPSSTVAGIAGIWVAGKIRCRSRNRLERKASWARQPVVRHVMLPKDGKGRPQQRAFVADHRSLQRETLIGELFTIYFFFFPFFSSFSSYLPSPIWLEHGHQVLP